MVASQDETRKRSAVRAQKNDKHKKNRFKGGKGSGQGKNNIIHLIRWRRSKLSGSSTLWALTMASTMRGGGQESHNGQGRQRKEVRGGEQWENQVPAEKGEKAS